MFYVMTKNLSETVSPRPY